VLDDPLLRHLDLRGRQSLRDGSSINLPVVITKRDIRAEGVFGVPANACI